MQQWSTVHMLSLPGDLVITSWLGNPSNCVVCRCVQPIDTAKTGFYCDSNPKYLEKCNFHMEQRCPKQKSASGQLVKQVPNC